VNVGVRYDFASPFTEKYGRMVNLDVGSRIYGGGAGRAGRHGAL